MKTGTTLAPPEQRAESGSARRPNLMIRVSLPLHVPEMCVFFPCDNRIGTRLLCALVDARLRLAGLAVGEVDYSLPFNDAAILVDVQPVGEALSVLRNLFRQLPLEGGVIVAWWCAVKGVWLQQLPEPGPTVEWPKDLVDFEAAWCRAVLRNLERRQDGEADS